MTAAQNLILHISSACNARCRNCRWRRLRAEGRLPVAVMSAKDVAAILQRHQPRGLVSLTGTGEPLLNPEFDEIVECLWAYQRSLYPAAVREYTLVTNGSLLHTHPAGVARLLQLPGHLEVSLDASSARLLSELRAEIDTEAVYANLGTLVATPRSPYRRIGVIMNVSTKNADDVFGVASLAHRLGLDFLMVTRTIQLALAYADEAEELDPGDLRVHEQIARAKRVFAGMSVMDFFTATGANVQAGEQHCQTPQTTLQVFEDGHVHLCCRAYDVDLGDWRELSFESDPVLVRLRQRLEAHDVNPDEFASCARCPLR